MKGKKASNERMVTPMSNRAKPWQATACLLFTALAGCSGDDQPGDTGGSGGSGGGAVTDAGLRVFTPPPSRPPAGSVLVTASGEVLALTGYAFPPASPDNPAFVDGWEVRFEHLLTTIDKVTLATNPDTAPGDQSLIGALVAATDGPFAVDLAIDGPGNIDAEGDPGARAVPLAVLDRENRHGNSKFATDGTRYAFSYDLIPATANAYDVNLDAEGVSAYREMIDAGCAALYVGTATFKGNTCRTFGTASDGGDAGADPFERFPKSIHFKFCFQSPTSYVNCQNGNNDPADPFAGEAHQRGIAPKSTTFVVAQVTLHTDHPFWESTVHDSPAHFDPFAARSVGKPEPAEVTLDDLVGVDFTGFTDGLGRNVPWRACLPEGEYTPPATGQMWFDPRNVATGTPGGDPRQGLRDFYDFVTYNQSTQGHLNIEDGLCFIRRNYLSPR
jgi:hypothetical protein